MKKIISLLAILLTLSVSSQTLIKPKQIEGSTAGSILTTTGTGVPTWTTNIPASATKAWRTDGNAVASNTAFIGTTDNRSFTIKSFTNSLAKLDSAGQGFTVRSFTAGNMPINISAQAGSFPVLSFQEDLSQNWAIYNNTSIADKPLVWYDAASASNVMVLTKGNLSVINNTNTAVFSGTNLGTAAANFPVITLRGVTYSTSISVPNLNHATLPNTSAWYTNALNGFCLTDGTNKLMSIASTSASGTGFILRPVTIGSTVAPTATLDVRGDAKVSSTFSLGAANLTGGNTGTVAVLSDALFQITLNHPYYTPADASTNYFGNLVYSPAGANVGTGTITIPYNCTLVSWNYNYQNTVINGSAGNSTLSIVGTTNYTLTSSLNYTATTSGLSASGLSQNFNAGDVFNIKQVNPTWATNPDGIYAGLTLWFVRRT